MMGRGGRKPFRLAFSLIKEKARLLRRALSLLL
jgi:hypothetical protein